MLLYSAACECGYRSDYVHYGWSHPLDARSYLHPGICPRCREVRSGNPHEPPAKCQDCGGPLRLYSGRLFGASEGLSADEVRAETFECPRCAESRLRFSLEFVYD